MTEMLLRAGAVSAVAAVAFFAIPAWANDAAFGGRGADPMPMTNDAIEMVEEHVVLRADADKRHWDVTVDFVFRNTSDEKVELTMGFPFVANDGEGDLATPTGAKYPEGGEPVVWDFRTWVQGDEVKVRRERAAPNPRLPELHYDIVYLRDVTFAPGETVKVKNTYRHGISESVMQDAWLEYVLRTGGLWKGGKIGRSRLEVHAPPALRLPPDGWVAYHQDRDGKATQEMMKFDIKPAGGRIQRTASGTSITWDLRDFAPKDDLLVTFVWEEAASNFHHLDRDAYSDDKLAAMSKEELRVARNTISARHGYVFKAPDLRDHFATMWWYGPNPDFDLDEKLTATEKALIRRIKELEGKAASRPASDPLKTKTIPRTADAEPVAEPTPTTPPTTAPTTVPPAAPKSRGCSTAPSNEGTGNLWTLVLLLGGVCSRQGWRQAHRTFARTTRLSTPY